MKKFFTVLIKTVLILVLILAAGWYAFGSDGPFYDQGQQLYAMLQDKLGGVKENDINASAEPEVEPTVEEQPEEEELSPEDLTTSIVFTGDVELSEHVQSKYDAGGISGVTSPDIRDLCRMRTSQ